MTQQCSHLVKGVAGGGVEETGKAKGEKGKINTTSTLAWQREGIYCGGMMIYVRGVRAVWVRRGRRCTNND